MNNSVAYSSKSVACKKENTGFKVAIIRPNTNGVMDC